MTMIIDEFKQGLSIIAHPSKNTKKKMEVKEALAFYYKLSIIPFFIALILGGIATVALPHSAGVSIENRMGLGVLSLGTNGVLALFLKLALSIWVIAPLSLLGFAAALQLIGKIWLKYFKNNYKYTLSALVYTAAVSMVFLWVEYIGIALADAAHLLAILIIVIWALIVGIWAIVVGVIALANQQSVSRLAALGIYLLTAFIVGVIVAIVVIAVVFGIVASGHGSGSLSSSSLCVPNTGFACTNPVYIYTTGNVLVTLGSSGASYYNVALAYAPVGSPVISNGVPDLNFTAYPAITNNSLMPYQNVDISLNATAPTLVETSTYGEIWMAYTSSDVGIDCSGMPGRVAGCNYVEIGTVSLKAI